MNMLVVGEDGLCCALGERLLVEVLPGGQPLTPSIDTKGRTKLLARIDGYARQARYVQPVLCIADTDGECVRELLQKWRPHHAPPAFLFRLAVAEAESWVLADRQAFADHFAVSVQKIPLRTDEVDDPKSLLLRLIGRSKNRLFRTEMVGEADASKQGTGYNIHLTGFVRERWSAARASAASESLARALARLRAWAQGGLWGISDQR